MASGAKIILSKLPVGDLATQFFADRNLFCAGRVAQDDMARVAKVNKQTKNEHNELKTKSECDEHKKNTHTNNEIDLYTCCARLPKEEDTANIQTNKQTNKRRLFGEQVAVRVEEKKKMKRGDEKQNRIAPPPPVAKGKCNETK